MRLIVVLLASLHLALSATVSYEGFRTYKVKTETEEQNGLLSVLEDDPEFDFWSGLNRVTKSATIMVSPRAQHFFVEYLKAANISYAVEIENVESTIQAERRQRLSRKPLAQGRVTFDQYLRHDEINAYLAQLATDYPEIVTTETIGQSYEGRDLVLIRISTGGTDKPAIFVDAGIHAREWISPSVALYLISQLVENEVNRPLIDTVDWIVLPSLNPDGYEYSWNTDRLWRKTRTPGTLCDGVDGNRNFDFHWMEAGASDSECSQTYAGPVAFSEVESRLLRDYLLRTANIKVYISLHSYGELLLYSWGWTTQLPENADDLEELGQLVKSAISAVAGTEYTVGSSTLVLYSAAGNSVDWSKGAAGIELAYTIELPSGGWYGFDLPPAQIVPVVEETFEGFKAFQSYIATKYGSA